MARDALTKFGFFTLAGALVCAATDARAQTGELPVIVTYVAPPECATASAFQVLVRVEVNRTPNPERPWRFSVAIRHEDDFVGSLKTEAGVREIRAATCDELTAALATIIAVAQPQLPLTLPPLPPLPGDHDRSAENRRCIRLGLDDRVHAGDRASRFAVLVRAGGGNFTDLQN